MDTGLRQHISLPREALQAGLDQLGIKTEAYGADALAMLEHGEMPPIFNFATFWPYDLYAKFLDASYRSEMVEVAVEALMRLNEDGSIKELDEDAGTTSQIQECVV